MVEHVRDRATKRPGFGGRTDDQAEHEDLLLVAVDRVQGCESARSRVELAQPSVQERSVRL